VSPFRLTPAFANPRFVEENPQFTIVPTQTDVALILLNGDTTVGDSIESADPISQ
jgi:hypothetical protein